MVVCSKSVFMTYRTVDWTLIKLIKSVPRDERMNLTDLKGICQRWRQLVKRCAEILNIALLRWLTYLVQIFINSSGKRETYPVLIILKFCFSLCDNATWRDWFGIVALYENLINYWTHLIHVRALIIFRSNRKSSNDFNETNLHTDKCSFKTSANVYLDQVFKCLSSSFYFPRDLTSFVHSSLNMKTSHSSDSVKVCSNDVHLILVRAFRCL